MPSESSSKNNVKNVSKLGKVKLVLLLRITKFEGLILIVLEHSVDYYIFPFCFQLIEHYQIRCSGTFVINGARNISPK